MPSKTFVPAFRAHVGEWSYYLCLMSYAQVAREINFAYELGVNKSLATMIQRGIGDRTEQITDYLLNNEHRFLGALIVAVWAGHPEYVPLRMAEDDEQGMLQGVDREFGVLTFDGTHQFFALDGQHRLRAIKDAVKRNPELGSEDIGVIVVPHYDTPEGQRQTRRLFTNINRNAVRTTIQENIALDEDDGFAILTRRMLDEHPFLSGTNVVQVFSRRGNDGELRLATRGVPASASAFTTIGVLYDLLRELGFDLDGSIQVLSQRATDIVLEDSYAVLTVRMDDLLKACGNLFERYNVSVGRDLRAPKKREGEGHPFMRPLVQITVVRAIRYVVEQNILTWDEALARISSLDWHMTSPPFRAVWQEAPPPRAGKMITGKDHAKLLLDLIIAHIAPTTKAQIDRALKSYRALRGEKYPVSSDILSGALVSASQAGPGVLPSADNWGDAGMDEDDEEGGDTSTPVEP